jgi:monofunctional biosynthetic peptidoglycan transglycosylase
MKALKKKFTFKLLMKIICYGITIFVAISCVAVVAYKFINPPITPLMLIRCVEGMGDVGINKDWMAYDEISKNVFRAVIASEDARFLRHDGIDWKAVENAKRYNELHKGKRKHGASTITMQTAKNVFLWNGRNFIRKGLEAYFSVLIEAVWGKKRILECYVNVIEWGNGIYGIEAASQAYFNKSASKLTKREAALLAAIIPNPRKYSVTRPTDYILKRTSSIQARMGSIGLPKE